MLHRELRKVRREKRLITKRKNKLEMTLKRVFDPDQLKALGQVTTRGSKWSSSTIKKALKLRFACGPTGYDLLLKQQQPLPSLRTLRRKMEVVDFEPGILTEVFENLKIKVSELKQEERECCLTLDEMSITASVEYDNSSGRVLGDVTLPDHKGIATHGLVFMLSGITTRWKQVIAYHYTGNSYDGGTMKPIVLDIIERAAHIGLHVVSVTSDMGSMNQAMWKAFGIVSGKQCQTINKIQHPYNPERFLYFLADVPHVLKNLKAALVNGQSITIPSAVLTEEGLKSSEVSVRPLADLLTFQEDKDLKLAPKLTSATLTPSHFEKMKVSHALNFFSHSVASALRYLVEFEGSKPDILTTAWFLDLCNRWFDLMSSRHPVMALSKHHPQEYIKAISFLERIIQVFKAIQIGSKGVWKPVQTGVVLSTRSILDIQEEILGKGHSFLLTSRFTQDCLENLFSSVRMKNPVPTPIEFKYALRIITVSQFLKTSHASNYQEDSSEFLADFFDQTPLPSQEEPDLEDIQLNANQSVEDLSNAEMNSLYYLVGYCISRICKNDKHCEKCISSIRSPSATSGSSSRLTEMKNYKEGCLAHPTKDAFGLILTAENIFRSYNQDALLAMQHVKKVLVTAIELATSNILFPDCHSIKQKLLSRYFLVRLQIFCKKMRA